MARVLLGITGSVAAIKTPELVASLLGAGHEVKAVATAASLYFFDAKALPKGLLFTDADEWPREAEQGHWQRQDSVLHIELRRWAELLLLAPLDANTLAKLAMGMSDNCLTCVWRAWDLARPVLLAPAMNTLMWQHPHTGLHLRQLAHLAGLQPGSALEPDELVDWINQQRLATLRFVGPVSKKLACGDTGQGAMAEVNDIVTALTALLPSKK